MQNDPSLSSSLLPLHTFYQIFILRLIFTDRFAGMTIQKEPRWPPRDGSLALTQVVDFNLEYNESFPMFRFVASPISDDVLEISMLEFGRACHRVAHIVRPINSQVVDGEVVAIMATLDSLHYHPITVGLMKAGLVPFPMSPRNSAAGIISILRATNCHRMLATRATLGPLLDSILTELKQSESGDDGPFELLIEEPPEFKSVYPNLGRETAANAFTPYADLSNPDMTSVAMYLHSSGSTGFPKPIPETQRNIIQWCDLGWVQDQLDVHPSLRLSILGPPPFHAIALTCELFFPPFTLKGVSMFTPVRGLGLAPIPIMPSSDVILEHARKTRANAIVSVPSFLEAWAQSPEDVEYLKSYVFVAYGGGPLPYEKGQFLVKSGVRVRCVYGATEFGPVVHMYLRDDPNNAEWNYLKFSDRADIHWVPQEDGSLELTIHSCETHDVSVDNLGLKDKRGYATSDLWLPHPTKPDRFKIVGRLDDVIVLASGEKVVPKPIEDTLVSNMQVSAAIVFGRERLQAGVLVEPIKGRTVITDKEKGDFVDEIWPVIEKANEDVPAFSRIYRSMVLVVPPSKPMLRTDKGTVKKKATIVAYEPEITALYERFEKGNRQDTDSQFQPPQDWTKSGVIAWLAQQINDITSATASIDPSKDLFAQRLDSLSSTFLRNRIVHALHTQPVIDKTPIPDVPANIIFDKPTLDQIAHFMIEAHDPTISNTTSTLNAPVAWAHIDKAVEQYSTGLGSLKISYNAEITLPAVVLLTGSTGNLGSYLLSTLVHHQNVDRIYCFNRPSGTQISLMDRQKKALEELGLNTSILSSPKVILLEGDATQDNLGLPNDIFEEIRYSVTAIIHNAWRLDLNLSIASFEPNLAATRKLIDVALSVPHPERLRFLFTSSVAVVQSWPASKGKVPEDIKLESRFVVGPGYGEAKYVAERVIENSGLQATSFRIGQIVHPSWAISDWFPILVRSGVRMGSLPTMPGLASWILAQTVSDAIVDTLFMNQGPPPTLHAFHPKPLPWADIIGLVRAAIKKHAPEQEISLVPALQWLQKLEGLAQIADEETVQSVPAIKLLNFFTHFCRAQAAETEEAGGGATLSCDVMRQISPSFSEASPLDVKDIEAWLSYWTAKGLLQ